MAETFSNDARPVPARVGALGLYATSAQLLAVHRSQSERLLRGGLTLLAGVLAAPIAFLIPPHFEWSIVTLVITLWFARQAWVGEWVVEKFSAPCPRCATNLSIRHGTLLVLPYSITCHGCRTECWVEQGEAAIVDEAMRQEALQKVLKPAELGGRPPLTWSPAASNWRDYKPEK
jgi:hypothetical protein